MHAALFRKHTRTTCTVRCAAWHVAWRGVWQDGVLREIFWGSSTPALAARSSLGSRGYAHMQGLFCPFEARPFRLPRAAGGTVLCVRIEYCRALPTRGPSCEAVTLAAGAFLRRMLHQAP